MERIWGSATGPFRPVVSVLAAAVSVLALAPAASAVVVELPDGHLAGVQVPAEVNPAFVPGLTPATPGEARTPRARRPLDEPAAEQCVQVTQQAPDNGDVCWQGGPVLQVVAPYLLMWEPANTPAIATPSVSLMERYLSDVSADQAETGDTYGVGRQYFDANGFADAGQVFSASNQARVDADPYPSQQTAACPTVSPSTACVTDGQIQSELQTYIDANHLPTGVGTDAPVYVVVTPEYTNVCLSRATCANDPPNGDFCGYHSDFTTSSGYEVIYAVVPFATELWSPAGKGCQSDDTSNPQQPNGDFADTIVDDMSHELNESITDPLPYTGWYDVNSGNEAADDCEAWGFTADPEDSEDPTDPNAYAPVLGGTVAAGTLYDQSINGGHFYTQTLWSDGATNCEASVPGSPVSPAFTGPTFALTGTAVAFDPSASSSTAALSSATWSFGDGETAFEMGAPVSAAHTYTRPGDYTVTLTLVDVYGDLERVSHTVTIASPPTASFSYSPRTPYAGGPISFTATRSSDPNPGGTIAAYAWSFGDHRAAVGAAPRHTFAKPGAYTVTLAVRDTLGLSGSLSKEVHVAAPGRITKITAERRGRHEFVTVTVSAAGTVRIGSKSVTVRRAARIRFEVRAKARSVAVRYRPNIGPPVTKRYPLRP